MSRRRSRLRRVARVAIRRLAARAEERSPAWFRWAHTWGASLALHGVGLIILAILFFADSGEGRARTEITADFPARLGEDLDSAFQASQAGDSFTHSDETRSPSLSIESALELKATAQPDLGASITIGPEPAGGSLPVSSIQVGRLSVSDLSLGKGKLADGIVLGPGPSESLTAPFSGRQGPARAELIRREGGTVRSEKAVADGIDWLARHQRGDGGWSTNVRDQCVGDGCRPEEVIESDTAATGLALLPMLGSGYSHRAESKYKVPIRRGLDWLVSHQDDDGDLFVGGGSITHFYSHAIGAMALCEAYGLTKDKSLRDPAQKAVNFIARSQGSDDGGWRYFVGQAGDTSVFGWQVFALRSARLAGLTISKKVFRGCTVYLDTAATDRTLSTYAYLAARPVPTFTMTAEALLGRQILGWPRNHPALVKGVSAIAADLQDDQVRNIYYWYYATQLLHNMQGRAWEKWNVKVRDALVATQVGGSGCDRGSWDALLPRPDSYGSKAGRLFETSLSLLTLEVYYRYLPMYRIDDGPRAPEPTEPPPIIEAKPEVGR